MTPAEHSVTSLRCLIEALRRAGAFGDTDEVEVIETHISFVVLAADHAYKFKKPVDLGFVDFSTLDKRRFYCEEELRLNRRLAPELYLDVVAVGGTTDAPLLGATPAIEYAVHMRRFPRDDELDRALTDRRVGVPEFAALAQSVAEFHEAADVAAAGRDFGSPALVRQHCEDNLSAIGDGSPGRDLDAALASLRGWTAAELARTADTVAERQRRGRVRECHGDMHLSNMVLMDGRIRVFDCIEFNAGLRWCDVVSDVAFLLMDLDSRGRPDLGRVFLNAYLEAGGDYEGLALLRLYKVYRSLVRAKVACLRARQGGGAADAGLQERLERHVRLAWTYVQPSPLPPLIVTCGLSGSGKTTAGETLIAAGGVVRIRSDVERKRLAGLDADARSGSSLEQDLYALQHTARTYRHLRQAARAVLEAGLPVVVDAAFLQRRQRDRFRHLARELGHPFRILHCTAPESVLRERVARRAERGTDASEADLAVLERQLVQAQMPAEDEREFAVTVDSQQKLDEAGLLAALGLRNGT